MVDPDPAWQGIRSRFAGSVMSLLGLQYKMTEVRPIESKDSLSPVKMLKKQQVRYGFGFSRRRRYMYLGVSPAR